MSVNRMRLINGLSTDEVRTYLGGIPPNEIESKIGIRRPWHLAMTTVTDYPPSENVTDFSFLGEIVFDVDVEHGMHPCPLCGNPCKVKEYETRLYYHTKTLDCKTAIRAKVPKLRCPEHGYPQMPVPWARPRASYTSLFEKAVLAELYEEGTVRSACRVLGTTPEIIGNIIQYRMQMTLDRMDLSHVTTIFVDEVAWKKGQKYVTVVYDQLSHLIFCTEGKDSSTIAEFKEWFIAHKGEPEQLLNVSCDMGAAYPKGVRENFPDAVVTYDKFHVMKRLYEGFELYLNKCDMSDPNVGWFKHKGFSARRTLSDREFSKLDTLTEFYPEIGHNFRLLMLASRIYDFQDKETAEYYFDLWYSDVMKYGAQDLKDAAETMHSLKDGILQWYDSRINNGIVEGMNSQFKLLTRRARGFSNIEHLKMMTYLLFGGQPLFYEDHELECMNVLPRQGLGSGTAGK